MLSERLALDISYCQQILNKHQCVYDTCGFVEHRYLYYVLAINIVVITY